jgi:hypothetical protein
LFSQSIYVYLPDCITFSLFLDVLRPEQKRRVNP